MPKKQEATKGVEAFPVKVIVTHHCPHFDEILAIFVLWASELAWRLFPGVESAVVKYWDAGTKTPDGRTGEQWLKESQTLCVGVGGGEGDEHPDQSSGKRRTVDECAATLIAKWVGVDTYPKLETLLAYAKANDLRREKKKTEKTKAKKADSKGDLATLVSRMHQFGFNSQAVFDWAMLAILAKFEECPQTADFSIEAIETLIRKRYPERADTWIAQLTELETRREKAWAEAKEEFPEKAKVFYYTGRNYLGQKKKLRLVVIESDNPEMSRFVRSKEALSPEGEDWRADVTVIKNSRGQVIMLGNGIRLPDVARVIKQAEAKVRGVACTVHWDKLGFEGEHFGWHYTNRQGDFLLNGGHSAPGTPPTRLSLERIAKLIILALSIDEFAPGFAEQCKAGLCAGEHCSWYSHGLDRCRVIRVAAAKARAEAT